MLTKAQVDMINMCEQGDERTFQSISSVTVQLQDDMLTKSADADETTKGLEEAMSTLQVRNFTPSVPHTIG